MSENTEKAIDKVNQLIIPKNKIKFNYHPNNTKKFDVGNFLQKYRLQSWHLQRHN